MRYPFLAGAAVVIATAALAACGSSAGGGGDGAAASRPSAAALSSAGSPSAGPTADGPAAGPSAGPAGKPGGTPEAPAGEPTPATGSFSEKQKEYLTDRVPEGMDPAAVLQTGQETCDRLRYLVKVDRDVAVGAIVTGEVADAKPAVAHLCPQHQKLVDEAALGYADGTHTGAKLRPGRYRAPSPTAHCSWQVAGADGRTLASGTSDTGRPVSLTVAEPAETLTSTGCYAWLPEGDKR